MAPTRLRICEGVFVLPALVRGELRWPDDVSLGSLLSLAEQASAAPAAGSGLSWSELPGAQILWRKTEAGGESMTGGNHLFMVLPTLDPSALLEREPGRLATELHHLPFREVLSYVETLRQALRGRADLLGEAASCVAAASGQDVQLLQRLFALLPDLLDADALAEAIDRELSGGEGPGRAYLDGWVPVRATPPAGFFERLSQRIFGATSGSNPGPCVRAVPTRQLHICAGNAPLLPLLSWLRAVATKGAAVVKSPAEAAAVNAVLAVAMKEAVPDHPITRHTSLVYWKGGHRPYEDTLFAPGRFDRVVVWGSQETLDSTLPRLGHTKVVALRPRYGVSLIGRGTFPDQLKEAAVRAACDSLIANQQACTASLVHYVEGSEEDALTYCRTLQAVLADWDRHVPQLPSRGALGRLRSLRRGALAHGRWFENGAPASTSSVIYTPRPFDLSLHPMSRCIVVRRLADLTEVLPLLHSGVSTVGVFPDAALTAMRNRIAACGVSNVLLLGAGERAYAGMPHDGMRILSELVSWTNG